MAMNVRYSRPFAYFHFHFYEHIWAIRFFFSCRSKIYAVIRGDNYILNTELFGSLTRMESFDNNNNV